MSSHSKFERYEKNLSREIHSKNALLNFSVVRRTTKSVRGTRISSRAREISSDKNYYFRRDDDKTVEDGRAVLARTD